MAPEIGPILLAPFISMAINYHRCGDDLHLNLSILTGEHRQVLIAIPAGMILCGAAKGVADPLEKGLRERILRFLKGGE